ncbi:MAG: hypothetical protein V3W11_04905 [bacterium]
MKILRRIGPIPRLVLAGVVAVGAVFTLTAAVKKGVRTGPNEMDALNFGYLDVGNFWNKVWNLLYVGDSESDHSGEWPGGSSVDYLYFGNLWFGTLISGKIYVSGDFPYVGGGPEWHELPPSDTELLMSNRGNWSDPRKPSYVRTVGDLDTYAVCDDRDAGESGPIPVKAEMHAIQWSAPGHDDWIVLECWITNRNSSPIGDCYVSLAYDLDIGGSLDYIDDLVGYDGNDVYDNYINPTKVGEDWKEGTDTIPDEYDAVNFTSTSADKPLDKGLNGWPRMMAYMYDEGGDARDTPGYCGLRVMGWMDDDDKVESLIEISSQHSWDIMNDPASDAYKYGYMIDVGTYEEVNTAYDWRIDPVFGPFELEPDEVVHWWTGVIMGPDLNGLRKNADALYADFLGPDGLPGSPDDWEVVAPPTSPRRVAVRGDNQVTVRWNPHYKAGKNTETDEDPRSGLRDFDGYIVWRSDVGFDSGWDPILWVDKLSKKGLHNPDANKRFYAWGWRIKGFPEEEQRLNERIPNGSKPNEPVLTKTAAVAFENIGGSFPTNTRQGKAVRLRKVSGYYELVDGVDAGGVATGELDNGTRYYYAVVGYDFGSKTAKGGDRPTAGGRNVNALQVIPLPLARNVMDDIRVVPNPYKGSADWEEWTGSGTRLGKIYFMNLPTKCTVRIYTIAGDLVRTMEHNDVTFGALGWDLTGEAGVQVASGIYVYHVDAPDYGEKIGKFAVLVGRQSQ